MKDETVDGATNLQEAGVGGRNSKRRCETLFDVLMEQMQLRLKKQRTLLKGLQAKDIDHLDQRILTLENKIDRYFDSDSDEWDKWNHPESKGKQPKKYGTKRLPHRARASYSICTQLPDSRSLSMIKQN